ncbi:MAG: diguanylate cyclase domain-containing protein [Thiopseudomonas sp.]
MSASDSRWKQKYSQLLDDYERLEEYCKRRSNLLERGLVRSSLAAEGLDPKLDKQLQALRDSIRTTDSQQLQQVVDNIERHLLATEHQRQERHNSLLQALQSFIGQLQACNPDKPALQALRKLQAAVKDGQQLSFNLHNWLSELSQLQAEILQQPTTQARPGLLSQPFSRKSTAETPAAAPEPAELPHEPEATEPEPTPASGNTRHTAEIAVPVTGPAVAASTGTIDTEPLRGALTRLLSELSVTEQDADTVNELRDKLSASSDWQTLSQTMEQLADLIIRISTRRQEEFGNYLQQLNSKLTLITSSVGHARESHQSNVDSAASLDQHLHNQVSELHQDVQHTTDLNTLKQRVDQRLNQFLDTLAQHQQQRKKSEQQLLQRLDELNEKVHLVENEAALLTSQLVEQHTKARQDALTGLPNRTAWNERLQIEYQRMQRQGQPLLLTVIDLDHFKQVNDTYGHLAGDKVLKILADRLRQGVRKTDFLARYGGEEFVLLLPDTPLTDGISLINKLREHIAACPFHFKGKPVQITFSAGIGQLQANEEPAATFARVDQALYTAKQEGRNRVRSAAEVAP